MGIIKGYRLLIVSDSTGNNVIADLGTITFSVLIGNSTLRTTQYDADVDDYHIFDSYVDDPLIIGGAIANGLADTDPDIFNSMLKFAPLLVKRELTTYVGNYVKLLNNSGCYAIGLIVTNNGDVEQVSIYDTNGSLITDVLSAIPLLKSGNVISLVCSDITNNLLPTNGARILSVSTRGLAYPKNVYCSISNTDTSSQMRNFISWLNMSEQYAPPPADPYSQGGESDTGGGTGNFDGTSIDVDFASLPTLSAVDTGFITLYNPTLSQLQSLANYMWSDLFDLDTLKKLFGDPMQTILGLSIVPGPVPSGGTQTVKVGNISTGVSMTKAASQYIDVDCGTLNVEEFWGAYLDYEPYTKAEIYLPYIGTHQIAVDDIMGKAVHIKYHIDILSGACAAEIKCGGSVLYTFIGSVAVSIPITGSDWTNVINGVLSVAGAIGSMVATGGATAPAVAGEIASAAVNSLKPSVEKSGSVSGGGGLMAGKVPVLILTRPRQALPASQNEFTGYPAFITRSLGAVSGYTEVHKIRLGGISATDVELSEIERLLKGGVIL